MAIMSKKPPALSRHAVTAPSDEQEQGERIIEARRLRIDLVKPNPWQPRRHAAPSMPIPLLKRFVPSGAIFCSPTRRRRPV